MTRVTYFVARRGIEPVEPQAIHLQGERFDHCAIDLADFRMQRNPESGHFEPSLNTRKPLITFYIATADMCDKKQNHHQIF